MELRRFVIVRGLDRIWGRLSWDSSMSRGCILSPLRGSRLVRAFTAEACVCVAIRHDRKSPLPATSAGNGAPDTWGTRLLPHSALSASIGFTDAARCAGK